MIWSGTWVCQKQKQNYWDQDCNDGICCQQVKKFFVFRSRQTDLTQFFAQDENLCFCTDVDGLLTALGYEHDPQEWRLFIDLSLLSLKAVLLHNGNI